MLGLGGGEPRNDKASEGGSESEGLIWHRGSPFTLEERTGGSWDLPGLLEARNALERLVFLSSSCPGPRSQARMLEVLPGATVMLAGSEKLYRTIGESRRAR